MWMVIINNPQVWEDPEAEYFGDLADLQCHLNDIYEEIPDDLQISLKWRS